MKYLKLFEFYKSTDKTINVNNGTYEVGNDKETNKGTIYDKSWESLLPQKITVNYHNQNNSFTKGNIMIHSDMVQITYDRITKANGVPDTLEFDIYFTKDTNEGKIKLDIDITYGDLMACEFSIESPNKVNVIEYTSYHSKNDRSNTVFALSSDSLSRFINFLNKFGMRLNISDFKFLDNKDNYNPNQVNESKFSQEKYIKELKDTLVDLEHYGFYVGITKSKAMDYNANPKTLFDCYSVSIYKIGREDIFEDDDEYEVKLFNIDDILETLKFSESYSDNILDLKLEYMILYNSNKRYFYKTLDIIPKEVCFSNIVLYFKIL